MKLLVIYEIADKASKVTSRRALREFEKWVSNIMAIYKDAAIERVARTHLFRLKDEYAV
jgi:hypothetical protein